MKKRRRIYIGDLVLFVFKGIMFLILLGLSTACVFICIFFAGIGFKIIPSDSNSFNNAMGVVLIISFIISLPIAFIALLMVTDGSSSNKTIQEQQLDKLRDIENMMVAQDMWNRTHHRK